MPYISYLQNHIQSISISFSDLFNPNLASNLRKPDISKTPFSQYLCSAKLCFQSSVSRTTSCSVPFLPVCIRLSPLLDKLATD